MKLKDTCSLKEKLWHSGQCITKQRHYFADKDLYNQSYGFSSSHVWMWELDHKKGWALKNWWFQTVVLEKTLESPLDCKEIRPVKAKGNQSWIFIGSTDAEIEAPIIWPPDANSRLTGQDTDAGKDLRQEEKWTTEDKMAELHHRLDGLEFELTPGVGDGQGSLVCFSPLGHKALDITELLTNILYTLKNFFYKAIFYIKIFVWVCLTLYTNYSFPYFIFIFPYFNLVS